MCTLTIIAPRPSECTRDHFECGHSTRGHFTLGFNRDEHPQRAELAPAILGETRRFIAPRDADEGGAWIAVNDAGIALAVLNRNEPGLPDRSVAGTSRGTLVPELAPLGSLDEIRAGVERLARGIARGFRLVATDGARVLDALGGAHAIETSLAPLVRPVIRTSSGLGDALVREPRTELFESTVARAPADAQAAAQRAFHAHFWSDRRHLSVLMDRGVARTVSQTFIAVEPAAVRFSHALRGDGGFLRAAQHELPRR